MDFTFAPLHSLGYRGSDDRFDTTLLPFVLCDELTIEDIEPHLSEESFGLWKQMLGESIFERMGRVKYVLMRRFNAHNTLSGRIELTKVAMSCLRLIRPMRQNVLATVRGEIGDGGNVHIRGFDLSERLSGVEVVEAHKLYTLRMIDAQRLRDLLPQFVYAMNGEFWKFRMAVQFHDLGYFQSYNWKPRFILWASALESIFTSHSRDHQGSRVAIARIKWFLGENARIYAPDEQPKPDVIPDCPLTLNDILEDIYDVRNFIAHGDKIPDRYFNELPRVGINGGVSRLEVLSEAVSFIIRTSLIKILQDGLLEVFADAAPAERFFAAEGLVNSKL